LLYSGLMPTAEPHFFYSFLPRKANWLLWIGCLLISCNKSLNQASNKAYIAVTNLVQGGAPVNISFNNSSFTTSGPLAYDSTTGFAGNHYLPVISGVRNFKAGPPPADSSYLNGNVGLQSNVYYSIFLYDSLSAGKAEALILQDNLTAPADSMAAFRFLNLYPLADTLYYMLTDSTDTLALGFIPYIGPEAQPTYLSAFNYQIHTGKYGFGFLLDSVTISPIDSLNFTGGKLYTIYAVDSAGASGQGIPTAKMLQHN
jgi:hypothetical protein